MSGSRTALVVAIALLATPALAQNPKNCGEAAMYDPRGPGDYVIEPKPGVVFTVYCHHAVTANGHVVPREYLALVNTGGNFNFGQYTVGAYTYGTDVRTSFTKVRIDPSTLMVDIGDVTFATSTGSLMHGPVEVTQMPLGTAMDCFGSGSLRGVGNIDLTGTPFEIDSSFSASGWGPGLVTFNGQDVALPLMAPGVESAVPVKKTKAVTVHGGGGCGSAGPLGFGSNVWDAMVPGTKLALRLKYVGTAP